MARAEPNTFEKDADAHVDYEATWANLEGDAIDVSEWTVEPNGEMVIERSTNTTTKATVWVSGGVVGTVYALTNRITTVAGRTDECTIRMYVK